MSFADLFVIYFNYHEETRDMLDVSFKVAVCQLKRRVDYLKKITAVYLRRVHELNPEFTICEAKNAEELLLISLFTAYKYSSDKHKSNIDLADYLGVPLQNYNEKEMEFLKLIQFNLNVSFSDWHLPESHARYLEDCITLLHSMYHLPGMEERKVEVSRHAFSDLSENSDFPDSSQNDELISTTPKFTTVYYNKFTKFAEATRKLFQSLDIETSLWLPLKIYLIRYKESLKGKRASFETLQGIYFAAIIVAQKLWCDLSHFNDEFAEKIEKTTQELLYWEIRFLKAINFNLFISLEDRINHASITKPDIIIETN